MGLVVAELESRFTANTSDLEGGLQRTNSLLDTLKSSAGGAIAALEAFGLAGMGMRELANIASELSDALGVTLNARVQQIQIALTNLGMTSVQAKGYLEELQQFANVTPFSFMELVSAGQRMLALGINAQQVLPILKDVAGAVAAVGGTKAQIDQVTYALTEMANTGIVNRRELRMLANDGVPIMKIMEDATGKSTAAILKMASAGELTADQVLTAFHKFSQDHWVDNLVAQSQTFSGAMATIRDVVQQVQREAFKPLFDELSTLTVGFANFTQSHAFADWAAQLTGWVQVIMAGLGILVQGYGAAMSAILSIVVSIGTMIYAALSYLNPFASHSPSLVSQVNDGTTAIATAYKSLGVAIPGGISPAIDAIQRLKDAAAAGMASLESDTNATMATHLALMGKDAPAAYAAARDAVAALETQQKALAAQITAGEAALRPYTEAVKDATAELDANKRALADATNNMRPLEQAAHTAEMALKAQTQALTEAEQGIQHFADAVKDAEEVLRRQEAALRQATVGLQSYEDAVKSATQGLHQAEEALHTQEQGLTGYEHAVRTAGEAVQAIESQIRQATAALQPFKDAVQDAQAGLTAANAAVQSAQDVVKGYQDQLKQATQDLYDFTHPQLAGTQAFSDKIFQNKQATEQLQLQLNTLQMAGTPPAQLTALRTQLEQLRLAGQNLQLQESLQLDPLRRQLEQIQNPVKELTFQEAIDGAKAAREKIDVLTPALSNAEKHLDAMQQAQHRAQQAVAAATAALAAQTEAMSGLNAQLQAAKDNQAAANEALQTAKDKLDPYTDAVNKAKEAQYQATQALADAKDRVLGPYQDAIDAQKTKIDGLKDAYGDAQATLDPYHESVDKAKRALDAANLSVDKAKDALYPLQEAIATSQRAVDKANDSLKAQQDILQPLKDQYADLTKQIAPLKDELNAVTTAADKMAAAVAAAAAAAKAAAAKGKAGAAGAGEGGGGFGQAIAGIGLDPLTGSGDFSKVIAGITGGAQGGLDKLKDSVNGVVKPIQDVARMFKDWADAMKPTGDSLGSISGFLSALIAPLGGALVLLASLGTTVIGTRIALALLGAVLGALLSPIGLLITGTTLLLTAWQNNFGGMRTAFGPVLDYIVQGARLITFAFGQGGLEGAIKALPAAFGQLPQMLGQGLTFIGTLLDSTIGKFIPWRTIMGTIGTVIGVVVTRAQELGGPLVTLAGQLLSMLPSATQVGDFFTNTFLPMLGTIGGALVAAGTAVLDFVAGLERSHAPLDFLIAAWDTATTGLRSLKQGFDTLTLPVKILVDMFGYAGLTGVFGILNSHTHEAVGGLDLIKNVFQAVAPIIGTVGSIIGALADTLVKTFGPMLAHLADILLPKLKAAWDQLVPALGTLWDIFKGLLPVLGYIAAIIGGVLAGALGGLIGIVTGVVDALPLLVNAFGNVLNILKAVLDFVGNFVGLFINFFVDLYNGVVTGQWEPMWTHFSESIKSMAGDIIAVVVNLVSGILNLFEGLRIILFDTVKGIWDGVVGFFTNMWNDLVGHSIIPDMVNAIITWFQTLGTKIGEAVSALWTNVVHFFTQLALDAVVQVIKLRDDAVAKWNEILSLIKNVATLLWNFVVDKAKAIALDVVVQFIKLRDDAIRTWQTAVDTIKTAISLLWTFFVDKAKAIALDVIVQIAKLKTDFETKITDLKVAVVTTFTTMWTNITAVFAGAPAAFAAIGTNMVDGLINGLRAAWGNLTSTLHNLAMQLPEPIRNALGIKSPSTETHDIGQEITNGLNNGIVLGFAKVQVTITQIAATIVAWGQQLALTFTTLNTTVTQQITTMGTTMTAVSNTSLAALALTWQRGLGLLRPVIDSFFGDVQVANTILALLGGKPDGFFNRLDAVTKRGLDWNRLEIWTSALTLLRLLVKDQLARIGAEAGAQAVHVGQSISEGIAAGIRSKIEEIAKAAAEVVTAAIRAAQSAAGAHSPSKVAADQVGIPIGEGIGLGIQQSTAGVLRQMMNLIANVLGVALPAFPGQTGGAPLLTPGSASGGFGSALNTGSNGTVVIQVNIGASMTDPTNPSAWEPVARAIGIALQRRGIIRNNGVLVSGSSQP